MSRLVKWLEIMTQTYLDIYSTEQRSEVAEILSWTWYCLQLYPNFLMSSTSCCQTSNCYLLISLNLSLSPYVSLCWSDYRLTATHIECVSSHLLIANYLVSYIWRTLSNLWYKGVPKCSTVSSGGTKIFGLGEVTN